MKNLSHTDIKNKLQELNISQAQVARVLKVHKDYLNQVLNGRLKMSESIRNKLTFFIEVKEKKK